MTHLFNRTARVTIGRPGEEGISFDQRFRIAFNVLKTDRQDANRAEAQIYGLSQSTRDQIQSLDNRLVLEVGYGGRNEIIAIGDLSSYRTRREPPDVITIVEAGDGLKALKDARSTLSFAEGTDASRIIDSIASDMGLQIRDTGAQITGIFRQGFSFDGSSKAALDKMAERLGFEWSIQDGEIQITDAGQPALDEVIFLSAGTGLVGSPERLDEISAGPGEDEGWAIESLLMPGLIPGGLVEVESRELQALLRIVTVEHIGDTRGPDWRSRIEAVEF